MDTGAPSSLRLAAEEPPAGSSRTSRKSLAGTACAVPAGVRGQKRGSAISEGAALPETRAVNVAGQTA